MTRKTIAVIFGGQSGEHEVSLVSGHAVMSNLNQHRYHILPVGITRTGEWLVGSDALVQLVAAADPSRLPTGVDWQAIHTEEVSNGHMRLGEGHHAWHPGGLFMSLKVDVIFPVLHGPKGEDGAVQGLFEVANIAYVGCGVAAGAVGMDKALMKGAFAAAGLPQLPYHLVLRSAWRTDPAAVVATLEERFAYPMFVKPANMGSSVGVSRAANRVALEEGLHEAARYDRRMVVEPGIPCREFEVAVLGNDTPQASVVGETVAAGEWFSYEAKYLSGQSRATIPATIAPDTAEQMRALAIRAFAAVDGAGLSRVDFLQHKETGELYLNEINTLPGFTPHSMYPKLWAASGLTYEQLLDRLIELALERHNEKQQNQTGA